MQSSEEHPVIDTTQPQHDRLLGALRIIGIVAMVAASELGHHYGGGGTIELAPFFWMLV